MKKILLTSLSFILLTSCATKQVLTPLASTTKVSNTVQSQSVIDESKRKGVFSVQLQLIDYLYINYSPSTTEMIAKSVFVVSSKTRDFKETEEQKLFVIPNVNNHDPATSVYNAYTSEDNIKTIYYKIHAFVTINNEPKELWLDNGGKIYTATVKPYKP